MNFIFDQAQCRARRLVLLVPWLFMLCTLSGVTAAGCGCIRDIKDDLAQQVTNYDNGGAPLVPTLLSLADAYDLPMGIEKVTRQAVEQPVGVKLKEGTLSELLDLCVGQLPGYAWALRDGVVHVFGPVELTQESNIFNLVVPSFEIREQTVNDADWKLGMTVYIQLEHPKGIAGSYVPSFPLDDKHLTFATRNTTVRGILNILVRLHGKSAWIARVPPEGLSKLPQAGLWKILPHSAHDPLRLLEPLQKEDTSPQKRP